MHLADAFIQSDLQCIQAIHCFISMCVPWELNPQPFALLTQCSTTEPQKHQFTATSETIRWAIFMKVIWNIKVDTCISFAFYVYEITL